MTITLTRKGIAIAVAAGLVTLGAATTVSYAAGSSASGVSACANSKGRLALANSKNKCAKGFKKVTIAKQGARGATGATGKAGATGKQGVAGPGIKTFRYSTAIFGGTSTPLTVNGYTWSGGCSVTGSGNSRVVVTTLTVTAPSGKSVSLDGVAFGGPDSSQVGSVVDTASAASASTDVTANSQQASSSRASSMLVVGDAADQLVSFTLYANPKDGTQFNPFPTRCSIEAVITPAA